MPTAASWLKRSGDVGSDAQCRASPASTSRPSTSSAPTRPSSSPMIEKMKSVCGFGQQPPASPRELPSPSPKTCRRTPRPFFDSMQLVAAARGVGLGAEEAEQPRAPVRQGDRGDRRARAEEADRPAQGAPRRARGRRDGERDRHEHEAVPMSGWASTSSAHSDVTIARGRSTRPHSVSVRSLRDDHVCGVEAQRELRELGGLDPQPSLPEPARRAERARPHPGHQHQRRAARGRDRPDRGELASSESYTRRDANRNAMPDDQPEALAEHDRPRRAVVRRPRRPSSPSRP